ncbi:glycerol-3-phosphate 1-O-acyltransferase PlsY [Leeia aquatica]|uniref:Glycerol-3-phosphate acyltransferase n=1 Tax=Leeia aquatica TaxID=2725557 RepID=A0A847SAR6_9NEIS|nr:glycerol-3-phosphate 1-O-acyltransferase PlsY [Leeia aquatica]
MLTIGFVLLAYLIGSISFAIVSSKLFGLPDPRTFGSKNPGATNMLRTGNKLAALTTLLGDGIKGWVAVALAIHFGLPHGLDVYGLALVVIAVTLGHMWPVFFSFYGGKGVATALGILLALDWRLGAAALGTWLLMLAAFRISSLSALTAALVAPLAAWWWLGNSPLTGSIVVLSALLIYRHKRNIADLLRGKESNVGQKAGDLEQS